MWESYFLVKPLQLLHALAWLHPNNLQLEPTEHMIQSYNRKHSNTKINVDKWSQMAMQMLNEEFILLLNAQLGHFLL